MTRCLLQRRPPRTPRPGNRRHGRESLAALTQLAAETLKGCIVGDLATERKTEEGNALRIDARVARERS
jgi:hypothetical protein